MRFVTLNLWGARAPLDRRLELAAAGLAAIAPDVVLLQEVRVAADIPNTAERLAGLLGGDWSARVKAVTGIETTFGQAFAWNPSGVGVKSEDTFILTANGSREIVTATPSLPSVDLEKVLGRATDVVKSGIA